MNKKLLLLGLIFFIPMMLSGCLWWPGGFVVNNHPHGGYYQDRDRQHNQYRDHSYQREWRGHRR